MNHTMHWSANSSNSSAATIDPLEITVYMTVVLSLCAAGCIANILIVCVILRVRELRTGCGFLIAHLSLTYILLCGIVLPLSTARIYQHSQGQPLERHFCYIMQFCNTTLIVVGYFNEALLAINRVFALCLPHYYRWFVRPAITLSGAVLCWVLALTLRVPFLFGIWGSYGSTSNGQCTLRTTSSGGSAAVVFGLYASYATVGVSTLIIIAKSAVVQHQRRTSPLVQAISALGGEITLVNVGGGRSYQRRMSIAKILLVTFLCGCLCNVPISVAINAIPHLLNDYQTLVLWLRVLVILMFSVHPILVFALCSSYRKGMRELFTFTRRTDLYAHGAFFCANISNLHLLVQSTDRLPD